MEESSKISPGEVEVKEMSSYYGLQEFDCGDEDLNEFLKSDSLVYKQQLIAKTFIVIYQEKIVAFFSVMNDAIKLNLQETKQTRQLSRLHEYPSLKIGRLGVDKRFERRGLGALCIKFVMGLSTNINSVSACRFITVDSYLESRGFYEKLGFVRNLMYEKKRDFVSMRLDLLE